MPTGSLRGHLLKKCVADREAEGPPVRAVPHLALARRSSQTFCNTGLPSAGLHLCRETDIPCSTLEKHRFENFLKDTQHLHRKRCRRNGSNTLAAKWLCLTKKTHTVSLPIYIAASNPQQFT